jgi:hypothetical protein
VNLAVCDGPWFPAHANERENAHSDTTSSAHSGSNAARRRLNSGGARLLERPALVWLGDVSHSFTVAISLVFARVSFTLVERPGMRIGPA